MMKIDPTGGVNNELGKWIQHSIGRLLCEWIVHGAWISKDHDKGRGLSYKKKKKINEWWIGCIRFLERVQYKEELSSGKFELRKFNNN